jgi:hypothetical protein
MGVDPEEATEGKATDPTSEPADPAPAALSFGRQQGDRMTSKDDALQQLGEIEEAQARVRQGKSRQIIDSIGNLASVSGTD